MRWLTSTLPAPTAAGGRALTSVPPGPTTCTGRSEPPLAGMRRIDRGAQREGDRRHGDRGDRVDVAARLRIGAGEVEGDLVAGDGDGHHDARRALLVRRRARGVEHVLAAPATVGQRAPARPACVARRSRHLARTARRRARRGARSRPRWRRSARRGRRPARRACATRRAAGRAAPPCSGSAGCGSPPAGSRWRRPGSSRARRRRRRRGAPGSPPTRSVRARRRTPG